MEVEKQKHDVEFKTSDVGALCSLMYAMRDLKKVVRFFFNEEGVEIREQACQDSLCIYANFHASRFLQYKATGEGMICVLPEYLYIVLANHNQRDEVVFRFNHKKETTLYVQIYRDGNEHLVQNYELPLLLHDSDSLVADCKDVDYLLAFDTAVITNIFSCLINNEKEFHDDWIKLTCEPKKVIFLMEHGISINHAQFTLFTDKGKEANVKRQRKNKKGAEVSAIDSSLVRSIHQNTVRVHFRLKYIHQLMKCFSINRGSILVYIKEKYPIMFEISVGMLGKLRLTLLTKESQEGEESEEEES